MTQQIRNPNEMLKRRDVREARPLREKAEALCDLNFFLNDLNPERLRRIQARLDGGEMETLLAQSSLGKIQMEENRADPEECLV